MIRHLILLAIFLGCALSQGFAQITPQKIVVTTSDPHKLYVDFSTGDTATLFYLKFVPSTKIKGCLVILPSAGETVEGALMQIRLPQLAVQKGLLVVMPSINWGTSTFVHEHAFLDTVFKQITAQHQVPADKFVLGGFSGGGMVSLSYAEKANRQQGNTLIVPKAVFALDPPVDFAHLYEHAERDIQRNFSQAAVNEGHWIIDTYRREFGGSPKEAPAAYVKYSIYAHSEADGGNARYLLHTPLRIYTEPDVAWQMKNRQRDLYDMNSTDISAMINLLQIQGNAKAEMIVTHNKGLRPDGTRHPHSWSIMDPADCLSWILRQLELP